VCVLVIPSVAGNIFLDISLEKKLKLLDACGRCERLKISRLETERRRFRTKTDKGTQVGLILNEGTKLRHGDVLMAASKNVSSPDKFILVEQFPEKVISIKIKEKMKSKRDLVELLILIGHTIGNRHKPIAIDSKSRKISFPIDNDFEIQIFQKLLEEISDRVKLTTEYLVFEPRQMN
jgi:urease accessory protein UreE